MTSRGSDTFGFDHEKRMTSTSIGGVSGTYTYNGDGLRVSRNIGGTSVSYTWDVGAGLPVILQDSQGNTYVYGLDLISRTDSGGNQEYYLYDGLGSTTDLANGSGTVLAAYSYDVFGAIRSQTGSSANEFKFTGEQVDGTSLQYLRARYYDPTIGRFLTQDPAATRMCMWRTTRYGTLMHTAWTHAMSQEPSLVPKRNAATSKKLSPAQLKPDMTS